MPHKIGHKSPIQLLGDYGTERITAHKARKEELKKIHKDIGFAEKSLAGKYREDTDQLNAVLLRAEEENNPEGRLNALEGQLKQLEVEAAEDQLVLNQMGQEAAINLAEAQAEKARAQSPEMALINAMTAAENAFTQSWLVWHQDKSKENKANMRKAQARWDKFNSVTGVPRRAEQVISDTWNIKVDKDLRPTGDVKSLTPEQEGFATGYLPGYHLKQKAMDAWRSFRGGGESGFAAAPSEKTQEQIASDQAQIERLKKNIVDTSAGSLP